MVVNLSIAAHALPIDILSSLSVVEILLSRFKKCYIITEWFFYINLFSLIIFYHSVWLGFELFGIVQVQVQVLAHIEYSSRSRAEDMTITNVIIKTPDRKWNWVVNDVMPRSDGLRIWWFQKRVSWDLTLGQAVQLGGGWLWAM